MEISYSYINKLFNKANVLYHKARRAKDNNNEKLRLYYNKKARKLDNHADNLAHWSGYYNEYY